MSRFANDDPIQEVSKSGIFSRLKRFEDDEEYNLSRKEKSYTNNSSHKSYSTYNSNNFKNYYSSTKYNNTTSATLNPGTRFVLFFIWGIFLACLIFPAIFGFFIQNEMMEFINEESKKPMPFETSLGSQTPKLDDELDNVLFSKSDFITFTNAGKIPTLYKFDKYTKANWCDFTELDPRFTFNVNTVQFNYPSIPELSKYDLSQGLINRNYKLVNNYQTGELYAINNENGYFLFVLISDRNIIYGAAQGNYEDVFNVAKK